MISFSTGTTPYPTDSKWVLLVKMLLALDGGTAGLQRVFRGSFGDPNGNVTANGDAVYYDTDGSYWVHDSAGNNDTNWVELIAA